MRRHRLAIVILFSLFATGLFLPQTYGEADGEILSLKQIDILIDTTAYNEALKALTKYMAAHPEDFDRAQKRVARIMKFREDYNKGAEELVDVIKNGEESKSEKLTKITELENSELDSTDTVFDFTNLARRTVTLGEVLYQYNKIMREGATLIKNGAYTAASVKFEEGFAIKNEYSDIVFETDNPAPDEEGTLVVYDSDITTPVRRSLNNVRTLVAGSLSSSGMEGRIEECEKAYAEYMQAVSTRNLELVVQALIKVNRAFSDFASLRNRIIAESAVMTWAEGVAVERNPRLEGTSYILFLQKFIIGDESNPDTGIIGAFDAYFNSRVESMKSKTNAVVFDMLNGIITNLPESKIYLLAGKIDSEQKNIEVAKNYSEYARFLHDLYNLEKNPDGSTVGEKHSGYASSMAFVSEYIADLGIAFESTKELAAVKGTSDKIDKTDFSDTTIMANLALLSRYEKIKSDSKSHISLVDEEQKKENAYFEAKTAREKEIDELRRASGGKIKASDRQKRTTAGVQISDDPLDFRKQIEYFVSIANQNLKEAGLHANIIWGYFAQAYYSLAQKDYDKYEKLCAETEFLFNGEKSSENQGVEFVKKYPIEARDNALQINQEIERKKAIHSEKRAYLSGGEEYRAGNADFNRGTLALDVVIKKFDSLYARNQVIITEAEQKIRDYENLLRDADEQYSLALAAFKKEDFDSANAAVDSASEKYAGALDIEYSEKIRVMREETLSALAVKIQQAEYEKVLREVYALKDKAAIAYYSSNFDSAESLLVTAQAKWAKVSTERDSEIEDMLNIVTTIKSIEYGRVLLQSDPHYPELSYSLDMAKQSFEKGVQLKKNDELENANAAFNLALTNIRNVQNVYPLNKEARLITLKIQQELDPEGFPRQFENQYNAARLNSNKNERLADLEDLYSINPKYPGLAQEIYDIKDSLGMFPKKEVKKEVKKSADSKISEARQAFKAAGEDEAKLNRALAIANEAIAIDGTNKAAKELKLQIQLKIGATSTPILSQSDEKMYAEAARLFNQRRFADAKSIMENLLTGAAAKKSRKVIDLYNRILKRL